MVKVKHGLCCCCTILIVVLTTFLVSGSSRKYLPTSFIISGDANYTNHVGFITRGGDLLRERMTVKAAEAKCLTLARCKGFTLRVADTRDPPFIIFKDKWDLSTDKDATGWMSYRPIYKVDEPCAQTNSAASKGVSFAPAPSAQALQAAQGPVERGPNTYQFCEGGRIVQLCGHFIKNMDGKGGSEGCLNFTGLKAESEEQCRSFEKSFAFLTEPSYEFNLTNFVCVNCAKRTGTSYQILGPWSPPPWNGLFWIKHEFESDTYSIGDLNLNPGDLLFDIGGNVGYFSAAVSLSFPGVKIVAFEPQPLNFLLLYHNIASNRLQDRVQLVNRAFTQDGSDVTMNYNRMNPGGSSTRNEGLEHNKFVVPSITFSAALKKFAPSHPQIALKMDCEGCEYYAYKDMRKYEKRIKIMRGELHPIEWAQAPGAKATSKELEALYKAKDPTFNKAHR